MAVLVEAISVVIRADVLLRKFSGGWDAFKAVVPNDTLCADNEIVRVGFMTPQDVESFINKLQLAGLVFLPSGQSNDISVVDQVRGPTSQCPWLEFGHIDIGTNGQRVAACRLVGSENMEIVMPPGWKFEGSLSSTFGFAPSEHVQNGLKFLRRENGLDVYLNSITGKEVYVGRTSE